MLLCTAGTAMKMNMVSATILIATSTELTRALFDVPMTSSTVTTRPIRKASRLNVPPAYRPVCSAAGNAQPLATSNPFM